MLRVGEIVRHAIVEVFAHEGRPGTTFVVRLPVMGSRSKPGRSEAEGR